MIAKQRQYRKFEENLKQAISNVEKYYSTLTDMKKDSANKTPSSKQKQIRRQKVQTCNKLENEAENNLNKQIKYSSLTPKQKNLEKVKLNIPKGIKEKQIKQLKMEQSFSNQFNTVKKQYLDYSTLAGAEIPLSKEEISLKKTKKEKQSNNQSRQTKNHQNIQELEYSKQRGISGNGIIKLQKGWLYKGQYSDGLFHGYGQLYHVQELVYTGNFQYGYFQGYGKLKRHQGFDYLISTDELAKKLNMQLNTQRKDLLQWVTYLGEFRKGKITGFGQLKLLTGQRIICKWHSGKIKSHHFTFTQEKGPLQ